MFCFFLLGGRDDPLAEAGKPVKKVKQGWEVGHPFF